MGVVGGTQTVTIFLPVQLQPEGLGLPSTGFAGDTEEGTGTPVAGLVAMAGLDSTTFELETGATGALEETAADEGAAGDETAEVVAAGFELEAGLLAVELGAAEEDEGWGAEELPVPGSVPFLIMASA